MKNKSGKSNINASSAWIESFNILQDSKDTENRLSPSYISFRDGKYAEWDKHQRDNIKKVELQKVLRLMNCKVKMMSLLLEEIIITMIKTLAEQK